MAFFAQFVAYYRNNIHLKEERIQFPVQIVAAGYMLAAISKLSVTGVIWINEAPQVSIQIMKNYAFSYFDTGNNATLQAGYAMSGFVLENALLCKLLFAISLFTELFAWVAVKNKLSSYIWGMMLVGMHIGIYIFMKILIVSIFVPMFVFMINPLYLIYLLFNNYIKVWFQRN